MQNNHDDHHGLGRFFIGPMPEKMLSMADGLHEVMDQGGSEGEDNSESSGSLFRAMDKHAFSFFMRQGGKEEDWDEDMRASVRGEMMKRWRENQWTHPFRRHHGSHMVGQPRRWVGASFEIGNVLGVNLLDRHTAPAPSPLVSTEPAIPPPVLDTSTIGAPSSVGTRSYVTAQTQPQPSSHSPGHSPSPSNSILPARPSTEGSENLYSSSSALLPANSVPCLSSEQEPPAQTDSLKPILKQKPDSDGSPALALGQDANHSPSRRVDRGRATVHYAGDEEASAEGESNGDGPAPPDAVLARSGSQVNESSAGATADAADFSHEIRWGDVVLRDRMLIRVSYTKSESLPVHFDEVQNRMTSHLQYEDWAEFLVVWRKDKIEIYEDYTIPGKEFFTGHKNLAFLIPLKSQRTSVSLYSFADLTFCILCPPTSVQDGQSKARALFHKSKEGTNVFVFKTKSRTRAQDWMWHLWRHLGGKIPSSIEIRCPAIETRVKIDVPIIDIINTDKAYDMFSRKNIIHLVQKSLLGSGSGSSNATSRDWKHVVEHETQSGGKLALAWRFGAQLDWVWLEEDVEGNTRPWAVLSGLSFRQGTKASHLELRLAEHFPATIHFPDSKKMYEPPGIEGYLDRIKPQGQARQRVYLVSHDGSLFALSPWDANPPAPPSTFLSHIVSEDQTNVEQYAKDLRESEVERGTAQIRAAYGVLDLRNIHSVRRAHGTQSEGDGEEVEHDATDDDDEGGPEGLAKVQDKTQLRHRRTFEIVLASGPVIRLEAHSCNNCIEWVTKLRALVTYWTQRHRTDAKDEMDVAYSASKRLRLTPRLNKCNHASGHPTPPEPPMDPGASLPGLTSLYHWCALENCRSILRSGRVFTRKGLRGQYKLVQLFLVSGNLIRYQVSPKSALHHRRSKDISLLDAYVCSGYLAALALRRSEYDPDSPNMPRRYYDGLEADEPEEDVLFIIWYRNPPSSSQSSSTKAAAAANSSAPIPSLSAKYKTVVFRTRSKVERDAWCWALGCEIDKVVRINKDRERRIREAGGLMDLSH
ncbi:hypothetical protein HYDPIDRAFT_111813, partial [Hydnomerulius pinastri MD-312]